MPESLGVRLRRRREEQHIALSTIAERTKIKTSLLEGLERDDVSHWPSGIYRRAFIKSYAHAIGLDPEPIMREFLEVYPDPEEAVAEPPPPPTGLRGVVGLALGSLARLGRGPAAESTPAPPRAGTLNLHEPAPPVSIGPDTPSAPGMTDPLVADFETDVQPLVSALSEVPTDAPASSLDVEATVPRTDVTTEPVTSRVESPPLVAGFALDLMAVARVCTGFARVQSAEDIPPLLAEAARSLGALGLIVWVWDPILDGLRPVLAHGYPDKLLAQLPTVPRDDDNATATAYRTAEPCAMKGSAQTNGALVVPLVTPQGASGVFAIELPNGLEEDDAIRAASAIFASMLAPLICAARPSQPEPVSDPAPQHTPSFTPPVLRTTHGRR